MSGRKHIILTFHKVSKPNAPFNAFDTCPNIDADLFDCIIRYVRRNYYITPLKNLCNNLRSSKKLAAITFDDGWRDNYEIVFPILQEVDLPATIFVTTGKINSSIPFWQQRLGEYFIKYIEGMNEKDRSKFKHKFGIKENEIVNKDMYRKIVENFKAYSFIDLKKRISLIPEIEKKNSRIFLSENEIYKMSKSKIDFGSHTVNHMNLLKETSETINEELLKSKRKLEKIINKSIDMISYPNGIYSMSVIQKARKLGYLYGFTTERKCVSIKDQNMALPRIEINQDASKKKLSQFNKYMFEWYVR